MPESTPHKLQYLGRPDLRRALPSFYRTPAFRWVVIWWAIPLCIGLTIFGAYMILDRQKHRRIANALEIAGAFDTLLGALLALAGISWILASIAPRWRKGESRGSEVILPALVAIGMLASNFIVAGVLASIVMPDY